MENVVATDALELAKAFIKAPETPAQWGAWRTQLKDLTAKLKETQGRRLYDAKAQAWASSAYSMGFLMLWDNELICHKSGVWQVDAVCQRAQREFGGYDIVVLWCNYPLSGVDPRHQIAYYDELPGGRAGLKQAVERFHANGIKVLLDHKPWVKGVPEGYTDVEDAFVDLVKECGLDGIYLDCSAGPEESFRRRMEERAGKDKIFVSEAPTPVESLGCEIGCWQQMTDDSAAPGLYLNRLLDRHKIVYESRRYFYDPIRELQRGWMNGGGQVIWENVFGYWAEYSPRCKSWMRLLFPTQRRFASHFIEGEWLPHVGGGAVNGVYVSKWTHNNQEIYTAVNRRGHSLEKVLFKLPAKANCRWVDIVTGQEYSIVSEKDGEVHLAGFFMRDGLAGIIPVAEMSDDLGRFLQGQKERYSSANWTAEPWEREHRKTTLPHTLIQPGVAKPKTKESGGLPPCGMVPIPNYEGWMETRYRMRECGYIAGAVDELHVYDAFEKECVYSRKAKVKNVAIDAFPVTNQDFKKFLDASGYRPSDSTGFLKHWSNGVIPPGLENHPVVYVCLEDARAYAKWAGKRIPTEEEWQAAGQGSEKRIWPWGGTELDTKRCNHAGTGTTPVDAWPEGKTPDGVWDMSGNVWELTESERTDGHTRYIILKGGSWYYVENSFWLFDSGARPADWGAKQILLCPGWDRCATIGFRCAVDY